MLPTPNSAIRTLFIFSLLVASLGLIYRFNERLENLEQTQVELHNELRQLSAAPNSNRLPQSSAETKQTEITLPVEPDTPAITPPLPEAAEEEAITAFEAPLDESERDDPFYGSRQAAWRISVFTDYQSKICRAFHRTVFQQLKEDLIDKRSAGVDFKLTLRDFPNESKADSKPAAIWANCWGEQKHYWEAFKHLSQEANWSESGEFSRSGPELTQLDQNKLKDCLNSSRSTIEVERDLQAALQLGAKGVPTILLGRENDGIFKGVKIRGAQSFAVIKNEVKKLIEENHEAAGAHS